MSFASLFRRPPADELEDCEWDRIADMEERRREELLKAGELEEDDANGVSEIFWAARRQRWTKDEPVRPGVYWCRAEGGPARVVEVYLHRGALRFSWTDVPAAPVRGAGLMWGDRPLEEPV